MLQVRNFSIFIYRYFKYIKVIGRYSGSDTVILYLEVIRDLMDVNKGIKLDGLPSNMIGSYFDLRASAIQILKVVDELIAQGRSNECVKLLDDVDSFFPYIDANLQVILHGSNDYVDAKLDIAKLSEMVDSDIYKVTQAHKKFQQI